MTSRRTPSPYAVKRHTVSRAIAFSLLIHAGYVVSYRADARPPRTKLTSATPAPSPISLTTQRQRANDLFIKGDFASAAPIYAALATRVDLINEERATFLVSRGYCLIRLSRKAEAQEELRKALGLNPADPDASQILFHLQNATSLASTQTVPPDPAMGWGPLASLAGRHWILSSGRPTMQLHYEWARVGINLVFAGRDAQGNRVEGQYSFDPLSGSIRQTSVYRGRATITNVTVGADNFIEAVSAKRNERQIVQTQGDGSFQVTSQKLQGSGWQNGTVSTLLPASSQMVAALQWPAEAPQKQSFWHGIVESLKGGALEGLKEGTSAGIHDAAQYRIRQITGTRTCKTVTGEVVTCP